MLFLPAYVLCFVMLLLFPHAMVTWLAGFVK